MCALIPETLGQRMDSVLRAEIIILVNAAAEIGIVVDKLFDAVRDEKTKR